MTIRFMLTDCLGADELHLLLQVIDRMGWTHDEPDEDGCMAVRYPTKDDYLFSYLDNHLCQ